MAKFFNYFIVSAVFITIVSLSISCKKCSTCTYDDKVLGVDSSEFCGRGNTYKNQVEQHEKNGWKCFEK